MLSLLVLPMLAKLSAAQDSLADIIEACEKSVVRIETKATDGDSLGSGFVVDGKGTIITNCHVLAGAKEAKVHFADGTSGEIVGTFLIDQAKDIVVARISLAGKPVVPLASALPRKGELVVALGSPHGLSFTATRGIISAIRSSAEMQNDLGDTSLEGTWIQVDAALSPGNSGGPLVNERGQVVAMSTLASRGSAQNLNFGISADDIAAAIGLAKGNPLVPLRIGVAKVKSKNSESDAGPGPHGRGSPGGSIIQHETASAAVIEKYVAECKDAFSYLTRDLRKEAERLSAKLKEMKSGETYIPPNIDDEGADIVRVQSPLRKTVKWFFRSEAVKSRELARQEARIREVNKLKGEIKNPTDVRSLFLLAWNFGPKLDPRRNNTIGFMSDAIVLHAFNEHEVLIIYEDTPYLLWVESTAGLTLGEQVMPCPVYVNGTATAATRGGSSTSVTVLQTITQDELKNAMRPPNSSTNTTSNSTTSTGSSGSSSTPAADGYRVWNDQTGKHSVEALLLSSDADKVRLKKRDGKVIEIPLKTLCDADVKYLKGT
jgi:S1-C subfamily serine protease